VQKAKQHFGYIYESVGYASFDTDAE